MYREKISTLTLLAFSKVQYLVGQMLLFIKQGASYALRFVKSIIIVKLICTDLYIEWIRCNFSETYR